MEQMDFMTFADGTNRYKEIREVLELVIGLPVGVQDEENVRFMVDPALKVATVSNLMQKLVDIPDAPTRASISKEMVEMSRVRDQTRMTMAGVEALSRELKAQMESLTIQTTSGPSGPVISQDSIA